MLPEDCKYSKEHEWIRMDGEIGTIGITDYAQQQLGDVVYVELPDAGSSVEAMQVFGSIESVKAVSELFSPVSGEVLETHDDVMDAPEKVNQDPHGAWLIKVKLSDASQLDSLMSAADYQAYVEKEAE